MFLLYIIQKLLLLSFVSLDNLESGVGVNLPKQVSSSAILVLLILGSVILGLCPIT